MSKNKKKVGWVPKKAARSNLPEEMEEGDFYKLQLLDSRTAGLQEREQSLLKEIRLVRIDKTAAQQEQAAFGETMRAKYKFKPGDVVGVDGKPRKIVRASSVPASTPTDAPVASEKTETPETDKKE